MIRSLILALAFQFITPVWAEISTEDVEVRLQSEILSQLDLIENPSMDIEVLPEPSVIDFNAPNYLELVYYRMISALVVRASNEGKPQDFYVNKFKEQWERERVSDSQGALEVLGSSVCPEGFFFATNFPNGSPLCAPASTHQEMENHRFSCAADVFNHTLALDFLFRNKYQSGYPIYDYWSYYPQAPFYECKNGTVWGEGVFCNLFDSFVEASIDHWHCNEHLRQLKDLYVREQVVQEKPCNDLGWSRINIWKPRADGRPNEGVVVLDRKYCDGLGNSLVRDFRIEDALGAEAANTYFRGCDGNNGGRLHVGVRPDGSNIRGPIFVRYNYNGEEECRRVGDPSKRQD